MTPTLLFPVHALLGRGLMTLLALQPVATPGAGHGGSHSGSSGPGGLLAQPLFMVAMVGFIYFFMLRPMNKQKQEQESLNKSLTKNDKVVTAQGIIGTIVEVTPTEVVIEIAERTRVRFTRESVVRKYEPAASTAATTSATPAAAKKS